MTKTMKSGIDLHALLGIGGTGASVALSSWNHLAGGAAALATAAYMTVLAVREFKKMKRDGKNSNGPLCENFSPKKHQTKDL